MFIKRMQELGFTLSEIDKLLGIVDKDDIRCTGMYDFVVQKQDDVQKKIKDLLRIEIMLKDLKNCCPDEKMDLCQESRHFLSVSTCFFVIV